MASSYNSSQRRTPQYNNNNNDTSANQSLSIYVGNISFITIEEDLEAFFNEKCGNVKKVRIIYDNNTGQSRGFGFVYFNTVDAFNNALELAERQLDGRELRIAPADSKNSSSSSSTTTTTTTNAPTGAKTSVASRATNRSKTQVVHCKKSNYDVYIGRPSDWGNPFVIGKDGDRDDVIQKYRNWIMRQPDLLARAKKELRGQRIACWCKPEACHGDVLAEIADAD
jgi:RNA recognition motif-containing protein